MIPLVVGTTDVAISTFQVQVFPSLLLVRPMIPLVVGTTDVGLFDVIVDALYR
jgi:hypothetical protein